MAIAAEKFAISSAGAAGGRHGVDCLPSGCDGGFDLNRFCLGDRQTAQGLFPARVVSLEEIERHAEKAGGLLRATRAPRSFRRVQANSTPADAPGATETRDRATRFPQDDCRAARKPDTPPRAAARGSAAMAASSRESNGARWHARTRIRPARGRVPRIQPPRLVECRDHIILWKIGQDGDRGHARNPRQRATRSKECAEPNRTARRAAGRSLAER